MILDLAPSNTIPSNDNNIIDPCVACGEFAACRVASHLFGGGGIFFTFCACCEIGGISRTCIDALWNMHISLAAIKF